MKEMDFSFCSFLISTAIVVVRKRVKPVFEDSDNGTYVLNVDLIDSLISNKNKAIIPVHLGSITLDLPL